MEPASQNQLPDERLVMPSQQARNAILVRKLLVIGGLIIVLIVAVVLIAWYIFIVKKSALHSGATLSAPNASMSIGQTQASQSATASGKILAPSAASGTGIIRAINKNILTVQNGTSSGKLLVTSGTVIVTATNSATTKNQKPKLLQLSDLKLGNLIVTQYTGSLKSGYFAQFIVVF